MNDKRWDKIESLIEQALELPEGERAAFIQKECDSDQKLQQEVNSLLQYDDEAFTFIRDFSEHVVTRSVENLPGNNAGTDQRIDKVVRHYHITEIIGHGGMGVVYKALDTKLDRIVALKFLPSHLTRSDKNKQRFIREAKSAAALNHPNICMVHTVEEHEGKDFISMEYINGQTLREKLKSGQITFDTALEYAVQIAKAIGQAHEKGIVHRDIKPGNIMINANNHIKVMDFGLAKMADSVPITKTGATLGTIAYMAPEQIEGKQIDHRADLFSLGVVLFEMLTGERPFKGKTDAALTYAIANEDPPLLSELNPELPDELSRLVNRLLEKDPEDRYQAADELAKDLKALDKNLSDSTQKSSLETTYSTEFSSKKSTESELSADSDSSRSTINIPTLRSPTALAGVSAGIVTLLLIGYWFYPFFGTQPPPDNSIAVLPLENMSTDPADSTLVDGVHVELINRLAGIGDLTVIARSSVLNYPAGNRDLEQIADQLGVSSLMEGTVQRADDQLRVSVQLVNAKNQSTIWSSSFEENVDDIFQMQSRIARQVAGELQASLSDEEVQRLEERPTDNPEAYQLYMQGRQYLSRSIFVEENIVTAEELLSKAVNHDPNFTQAWAMMTVAKSYQYWIHGRNEKLENMIQTANRALDLGPDLPETQIAVGLKLYWTLTDHEKTLSHFETALQQFPNQPLLHLFTGLTHRRLGNWRLLIKYLKSTLELDPLTAGHYTELAWDYWLMRDYDNALATLDKLRELKPDTDVPFTVKFKLSKNGTLEIYEQMWDDIHPDDPAKVAPAMWSNYNAYKRNWEEAIRGLENIDQEVLGSDHSRFLLKDNLIAIYLDMWGQQTEAQSHYIDARERLENLRDEYPNEPKYRMALAKVYAHLGESKMAIQEGIKATQITPFSQDAEVGALFEFYMAEIYTWTGHEEKAIDKLEFALSVPSHAHRNLIKLDPRWDPLRDNPRFRELIAGEDEPYLEGL